MAESYARIQKQIAALQAQAEKARNAEKAGVIAQAKEAIRFYDIQLHELFGTSRMKAGGKKSKVSATAKYADGSGNEWGGRGPRPQWVRDAIAAGKSLDDLLAGERPSRDQPRSASGAASAAAPQRRRKKKIPVKFKDASGNTWTGRGSQPRWLRAALAAGKKLDDLRV